jgi:hypothetical protein
MEQKAVLGGGGTYVEVVDASSVLMSVDETAAALSDALGSVEADAEV